MPDPLTSELIGGPLDGATVNIRLGAGVAVIVEDERGRHLYGLDYTERARLVYLSTDHPPPKKIKATKLKGGVE